MKNLTITRLILQILLKEKHMKNQVGSSYCEDSWWSDCIHPECLS